jgi:TniQ
MSLPCRPIPRNGESIRGLLMRAATLNGWKSTSQFISTISKELITSDIHSLTLNPDKYLKLLKKMNIDSSSIVISPRREHYNHRHNVVLNGIYLDHHHYRTQQAAICPVCTAQNGYHHYVFDLRFVNACHIHNVSLLDACPGCNTPLTWKKDFLLGCTACGRDLLQQAEHEDAADTVFIIELIESQQHEMISSIADMYSAMSIMANLDWLSPEMRPAKLATLSVRDYEKFQKIMCQLLEKSNLHPRLLMYSFLTSKSDFVSSCSLDIFEKSDLRDSYKALNTGKSVTLSMGAQILGISVKLLRDLIERRIIYARKLGGTAGWEVSLDSINQLLCKLSQLRSTELTKAKSLMKLLNHPQFNRTFAEVIAALLAGEVRHVGFSLSTGISSIQVGDIPDNYFTPEVDLSDSLNMRSAASKFGWSYNHMQQLTKVGAIPSFMKPGNTNTKMVRIKDIELFNEKFVISSILAKEFGARPLTLPKLLMHHGLKPAYSPSTHDCNCYVFRRQDIESIDLQSIVEQPLPTGSWGAPKGSRKRHYKGVKTGQAAFELGIPHQTITALIRRGILNKSSDRPYGNAVTRESLNNLISYKDSADYIELEAVLENLNLAHDEFHKLFIQTDLVEVVDLHFLKLIHQRDISLMKEILDNYLTSAQAAQKLDEQKYQFRNRVKQGQIKPSKSLTGSKYTLDLFLKTEVEALLQ